MNFTPPDRVGDARELGSRPAPRVEIVEIGDGGTPPARPVSGHSGAISAPDAPEVKKAIADMPPDTAMLRRILRDLEAAWLADLSVAPHDDAAAALLAGIALTWQSAAVCLEGMDPRFLRALLLRGVSRLWTAGPAARVQPA